MIPFEEHGVSRENISYGARKVTDGLHAAGYSAYVVGGAVRDMLLKRHPKDFDIATDATPEQVRRVFRRSRIIGRRFRLVHVMFGEETVEVSTFRRMIEAEDAETDEHGRLLRDNEFGDQEQESARRDFTASASGAFSPPRGCLPIRLHRKFFATTTALPPSVPSCCG